jgi:hypothetical protein
MRAVATVARKLSGWTRWGRFCRQLWAKHLGLGPVSLRRWSLRLLAGFKNVSASFFQSASTNPLMTNSFP